MHDSVAALTDCPMKACLEAWYLTRDLHNSSVYTWVTHSHETGTTHYSQQLQEQYTENNHEYEQF